MIERRFPTNELAECAFYTLKHGLDVDVPAWVEGSKLIIQDDEIDTESWAFLVRIVETMVAFSERLSHEQTNRW